MLRRRRCSPVKGLFSITSSASAACLQVVHVPPPATCLYGSDRQANGPDDGMKGCGSTTTSLPSPPTMTTTAQITAPRMPSMSRHPCTASGTRTTADTALPVLTETWGRRSSPGKGLFRLPSLHHLSVLLRCSGVRAAHLGTLPPLVFAASNGSAETGDSEDAWVEKDDVTVTTDHDNRGDWMLTPMPACVWHAFSASEPPDATLAARGLDCETSLLPLSLRGDCDELPAYTYDTPDMEPELRAPLPYLSVRRRQSVHPRLGARARQ
ncbi:hypothetical protein K438DRAFT_1987798 [Mycena galopus ATCC 62051]|nr:hypothetical protein K438DRAFT_1987798 [Mycena galopus ATCC 62051]